MFISFPFAYPTCCPQRHPHLSQWACLSMGGGRPWSFPYHSRRVTGRAPGHAGGGPGLAPHCGEPPRGPSSGPQMLSPSPARGTNACLSHFPAQKPPWAASSQGTKCACLSQPSRWLLPLPGLHLQAWGQALSSCQAGQTQAPWASLTARKSSPHAFLPV